YPWGSTASKRTHVNWPRCWLMALANMAGNRFMTSMVWPHLLTSFRSDTAENAHGKPWRNSATKGLYVRPAANGSEFPLLLTTMQVTRSEERRVGKEWRGEMTR